MTALWGRVETLIQARDFPALAEACRSLDAPDRKMLLKPVREFARSGEFGWAPRGTEGGLAIAGAAVMPDARAAASWIRRFPPRPEVEFDADGRPQPQPSPLPWVYDVLTQRAPSWLPNLVTALADRLRFDPYDRTDYDLVESLRRHLSMPRPALPAYVAQWFTHEWHHERRRTVELEMRPLLPLLFETDGVALLLRDGVSRNLDGLGEAGMLDRPAFLDACLARLERGGRPAATNEFAAVLEQLAPTSEEVEARVRSYLLLLRPGSTSVVAGIAQREVLALHDRGRIEDRTLLEVSASVLLRTEKKLVRTQLDRLASYVTEQPAATDEVAVLVATAFGHPAADIQSRAVAVIERLSISTSARTAVLAAAQALPADLRARLGPDLAPDLAPRTAATASVLPAPPVPARVEPIESPEEAIAELVGMIRNEWIVATGGMSVERVIEALPRYAATDPERLRRIGQPLLGESGFGHWLGFDGSLRAALVALLASSLGQDWEAPYDRFSEREGAPHRALCMRVFDLAVALRTHPVRSVALPTLETGAIAAEDLLARLAAAASEGWAPAALDLEQALLRLDPATAPGHADSFAALETDAGNTAAAWLAVGGHRRPLLRLEPVPERVSGPYYGFGDRPNRRFTMAFIEPDPVDPLAAGPIWSRLAHWASPELVLWGSSEAVYNWWPLALPHARELAAGHLLLELARSTTTRGQAVGVLWRLACADGEVGDAVHAALAYGLCANQADARADAVDALLVLAGRGQLDGAALGTVAAEMIDRGELVAKRMVTPLADLAAGGAARHTWLILRELLTRSLKSNTPPSGFPDLLALAVEVAGQAAEGEDVPGLHDLAQRKGSARQVIEARRLVAALAGPV